MKVLGTAIAAGIILLSGTLVSTDVSAQSFRIGPNGIRIYPDDDDRWDRRRRDRCRTIIERERNRWGEWVETRRRVCRRW
jgi:hypothetical protein